MLIKDVSKKVGVSAYTIRYYEKLGLIHVSRDDNGIREFTRNEIWSLQQLTYFRRAGVPIKDVQRIFSGQLNEDEILQALYSAKARLQQQMADLKQTAFFLDRKIDWHENHDLPVSPDLDGIEPLNGQLKQTTK